MTLLRTKRIAALAAFAMVFSLLASLISASAVSQSEIDALQADRDVLAGRMEELQGEISTLQSEQAGVIEQKAALDQRNELMRQEIEIITEQIDMYASLIDNKAKELADAEAAEAEQYERYRSRMRAMEENGKLSYIAVLFEATSFSDLLARLDFISEIMEYDKGLEDAYVAAAELVAQVKAEFETTKTEQEAAQAELEAAKAELEAQIEQAIQLIASLESDIEAYTALYEENAALEAELDSQINGLIAQLEAERKAAEEAARQNGGSSGVVTGNGSLIWPCGGSVSSYYGNRMHPILGYERPHSGIDISAGSGTPIAAADGGTVAIATYSSSYGNYIMINHGNGVYTVYAHMSSMAVSAGASVSQGQVIGYVGSTGLSTGPHLHFEVRVNGSTVDPLSYL